MEQVRSEVPSHDEPPGEIDLSALLDECADVAAALGRNAEHRDRTELCAGHASS